MPSDQADTLAGSLLNEDSFDLLIDEDADVLKPDGTPLLYFRRQVLSAHHAKAAWQNLRDAANITTNRGMAAGVIHSPEQAKMKVGKMAGTRFRPLKQDGTLSNSNHAIPVNSGIVGYFDRNPRYPYCRTTAYNLEQPERFAAALPFIREVSEVFKAVAPARFAAQYAMIQQTNPDFYIHGTAFSTITVNKNWQTAVHKDQGDYQPGMGVMAALRAGSFKGCYLCWPAYRVAVDLRNRDMVVGDVHEWHGNTPFHGVRKGFERISCIFYYRAGMWKCGSAAEELETAKRRQPGPLYD